MYDVNVTLRLQLRLALDGTDLHIHVGHQGPLQLNHMTTGQQINTYNNLVLEKVEEYTLLVQFHQGYGLKVKDVHIHMHIKQV